MTYQWLNIVGVSACCALLIGCSGSSRSARTYLAPMPNASVSYHQPQSGGRSEYRARPRADRRGGPRYALMSPRGGSDYGSGGQPRPFDTAPEPRRPQLLSPTRPVTKPRLMLPRKTSRPPPLRRFAAMPRYKPHAPHVRQSEASCLRSGIVRQTRFVRFSNPVGRGACRISKPFEMAAAGNGAVRMEPSATLRCQMVPSVEAWVADTLRPAAQRYLGSEITQIRVAGSYGCRTRNSKRGAKLSEHGRANALDISGFRLANGKNITVKRGWRGSENVRRFLRYVHRGACEHFSTVLGPNADRYHHDHFHFDLASHGRRGSYRVCK